MPTRHHHDLESKWTVFEQEGQRDSQRVWDVQHKTHLEFTQGHVRNNQKWPRNNNGHVVKGDGGCGNILRIIDVFITYIHALNALDIKPGLNDRAFLKDRLMVKAEEIVGEGIIIDLLFVNIFQCLM